MTLPFTRVPLRGTLLASARSHMGMLSATEFNDMWARISAAQNALVFISRQMGEIGKDEWNKVSTGTAPDFDWIINEIHDRVTSIVAIKSTEFTNWIWESAPSFTQNLVYAEARAKEFLGYLNAMKKLVPQDLADNATAVGRKVTQDLIRGNIKNPATAGWEEFKKAMDEKLKILNPFEWPWWVWALGGAIGLFLVYTAIKPVASYTIVQGEK